MMNGWRAARTDTFRRVYFQSTNMTETIAATRQNPCIHDKYQYSSFEVTLISAVACDIYRGKIGNVRQMPTLSDAYGLFALLLSTVVENSGPNYRCRAVMAVRSDRRTLGDIKMHSRKLLIQFENDDVSSYGGGQEAKLGCQDYFILTREIFLTDILQPCLQGALPY